mmetsp:Transcript_32779/g.99061  ORF Transcript_32779/g.99061 Transcript_32779/m.99061 type:complete len:246 (-) Transcript_32779:6819-7556(-)
MAVGRLVLGYEMAAIPSFTAVRVVPAEKLKTSSASKWKSTTAACAPLLPYDTALLMFVANAFTTAKFEGPILPDASSRKTRSKASSRLEHTPSNPHTRSAVALPGTISSRPAGHTVNAVHVRSDTDVAATDSNSTSGSQGVRSSHTKSDVGVAGTVANSKPGVHGVTSVHTLSPLNVHGALWKVLGGQPTEQREQPRFDEAVQGDDWNSCTLALNEQTVQSAHWRFCTPSHGTSANWSAPHASQI